MKRGPGPQRRTPLRADADKLRAFVDRGRATRPNTKNGAIVMCARDGCANQFYLRGSRLGGRRYCSRECWRADTKAIKADLERGRDAARAGALARHGEANPNYRHGARSGIRDRAGEKQFRAVDGLCAHPLCKDPTRPTHAHHVTYEQHVRKAGGDRWDPRNALRLCVSCHMSHHRRGRVLPLTALRDVNITFAVELFGAAAYDYLRRYYAGTDSRVEALIDPARRDSAHSEMEVGSDG